MRKTLLLVLITSITHLQSLAQQWNKIKPTNEFTDLEGAYQFIEAGNDWFFTTIGGGIYKSSDQMALL